MLINRKMQTDDVMGIDCSTKRLAFGIISGGKLKKWGIVEFEGDTIYDRIQDARIKIDALAEQFPVKYIAIEAAIMVKSVQVAIKMAYVFGAVMASLLDKNKQVHEVAPISWQNHIGNKLLTAQEKNKIKSENPGKSKAWYTNANRLFRKDRTRQWVRSTHGVHIESDDVCDSIGLAQFAYDKMTRR